MMLSLGEVGKVQKVVSGRGPYTAKFSVSFIIAQASNEEMVTKSYEYKNRNSKLYNVKVLKYILHL